MPKLLFSVAAVALLVAGSVAHADDELISAVKSVSATAGTMTLINNATYKLPETVKAADLKLGQVVRITFKVGVATAVTLTPGAFATGTVKSYDDVKGAVTLDDGKIYMLLPTIDPGDVKVGNKVKIGYAPRLQDNANMVATVDAAK